ncbi:hypothetical protein RY972_09740 [Aeromonas allosaccharophila]|uniref:Uncharacterized protein n=1 Tax=Aeromonas allosaccharophila TaxID=656 RepID=A0ABZ0FFI5_9GAMM|nr:hypothetical protein [Aeromonas allosaccharophila]WOE68297.1 hypothetical protein RY972_09740 [Aeromonas allosaccharophila]
MEHLAPDADRPLVLLVDDKTDSHKVMNALPGELFYRYFFSCEAALVLIIAGQNEEACRIP